MPPSRQVSVRESTASASISISMSGSMRDLTSTIVVAGGKSRNASPWARPNSCHCDIGDEHPRPHDRRQIGSQAFERPLDQQQTAFGLRVRVPRFERLAVVVHGRGAGDEDQVARLDGPAIADFAFPRRGGKHALSGHRFLSGRIQCRVGLSAKLAGAGYADQPARPLRRTGRGLPRGHWGTRKLMCRLA